MVKIALAIEGVILGGESDMGMGHPSNLFKACFDEMFAAFPVFKVSCLL